MREGLVVLGLGGVGRALARTACRAGWRVVLLDRDEQAVDRMLREGFAATTKERVLGTVGTVAICAAVPQARDGAFDLSAVRCASEAVSRHLRPGALIALESVGCPRIAEEVVRPSLERSGLAAGTDFRLAWSPRWDDPALGQPKVVTGLTARCADAAASFYGTFLPRVRQTAAGGCAVGAPPGGCTAAGGREGVPRQRGANGRP
ncbi:NAD(P)-binding domain-containing protein [Kitasatospora sp. NPDC056138]|uniref:NAD(P)-binding domain-containing protein n=1 Tax=Kitasatospora sp. NPDC056138 TaxID=3345724 RepID=UPI0035DDDF58